MAKRGRKPNPNKKRNYFSDEEEAAVIQYLNTDDVIEKNKIYNLVLRPAFNKMVESIIRRYKLYVPEETFEEIFNDAISFILTKADKFNPGKYKAYSYYGTICKNYLIGRIQSYNKHLLRNESFDEGAGVYSDSLHYSSFTEKNSKLANEIVDMLVKKIDKMINDPEKYVLKESEIKLGVALKNLLENWDFVLTTDGSNKLNKNAILFFLKDSTGFDTKGVRDNMKKYKNEFLSIKQFLLG
jgi:hypothetical protein